MGYTRVKQLSAGHNSVDYHENAPVAPGKGGSPGKQSAAHIITGARAAAGAGASARSARAALVEGGASSSAATRAARAPRARAALAARAARRRLCREEGTPSTERMLTLRC